MEYKIRNKRALGELFQKCLLWDENKNTVLSSPLSIPHFDAILSQRVAEEIQKLGSRFGDSARHLSELVALFGECICEMKREQRPVFPYMESFVGYLDSHKQQETDKMLMCVNFYSRKSNASWVGLLDKYKSYSRQGLHYSKALLASCLYSSLSNIAQTQASYSNDFKDSC